MSLDQSLSRLPVGFATVHVDGSFVHTDFEFGLPAKGEFVAYLQRAGEDLPSGPIFANVNVYNGQVRSAFAGKAPARGSFPIVLFAKEFA